MYYDNKRSFYIKQYGPKVFLAVFSVCVIGLGAYIYLSSMNPNAKVNEPNADTKVVAAGSTATEEVSDISVDTSGELPKTLGTLRPLQKTAAAKIDSVNSDGSVVVNIENTKITVYLIGVDFKSSSSDVSEKMNEELKDKEIKLSFDKEKTVKNQIFAYLYVGDTFYNASIIEKGYATVKREKDNVKLESELISAQAYAKQTQVGIWSNQ